MVGVPVGIGRKRKTIKTVTFKKSDFYLYQDKYYVHTRIDDVWADIKTSDLTIATLTLLRPSKEWYHTIHISPPIFIFGNEIFGNVNESIKYNFLSNDGIIYWGYECAGSGTNPQIIMYITPDKYNDLLSDDEYIIRFYRYE